MAGLKDRVRNLSEGKAAPPPIMVTLGMKLVRLGEGTASLKIKVDRSFHNPMGTEERGWCWLNPW